MTLLLLLGVNCIKAVPGRSVLHVRRYQCVLPKYHQIAEHVDEDFQLRD